MALAATFDISAGAGTLTGEPGVNNTMSMGGGTSPNFVESVSGGTINLGAGASGTWTGGGTSTITESTPNSITAGITINLGDGTNALNINRTGGTTNGIAGTVTVASSGTDAVSVGGSSANPAIIVNDISIAPTAGTQAITLSASKLAVAVSVTIGQTTITGLIGATQNKTITYANNGGTISSISVTGQNTAGPNTWTLDSPKPVALNTGSNTQAKAVNIKSAGGATTITGASSGASTIQVGTVAGSSAGLDGIAATVGITGSGTTNSIRIDDTGSATGSKTYTITPNASQTSDSTFAGSSFSTISYKTQGSGTWASGLRFDGSSVGSNTFTVVNNFLDNATIVGNGGNTNSINFPSGGSVTSTTGTGGGVYTQSNSKTITFSGMSAYVAPANSVAPSCTPSSGTTADSFVFSSGTWTGSPTSWSWEYRTAGSGSWTQFSTSQNPTISGSTFGTGTWDTRLTATNLGGPSTPANGTTITVSAPSGGRAAHLMLLGST